MIEKRSRSPDERMPRGTRGRRKLKAEAKASREEWHEEHEGIGDGQTPSHAIPCGMSPHEAQYPSDTHTSGTSIRMAVRSETRKARRLIHYADRCRSSVRPRYVMRLCRMRHLESRVVVLDSLDTLSDDDEACFYSHT